MCVLGGRIRDEYVSVCVKERERESVCVCVCVHMRERESLGPWLAGTHQCEARV